VRHSGANRRPSWCYGTAGIARCLQLAALALNDTALRSSAEGALVSALTDPTQRAFTTDASLCHGYAGLARIAAHAAAAAPAPAAAGLQAVVPALPAQAPARPPPTAPGLREGAAGTALAALAPVTGAPAATSWDSFLLI